MYETYLLSGRRAPFLVRGWLYGVLIQMADRHLIVGPTQVMSLTLGNKFHVTVWSHGLHVGPQPDLTRPLFT